MSKDQRPGAARDLRDGAPAAPDRAGRAAAVGDGDAAAARGRLRGPGRRRQGGTIKRITEYLNPRVARIVALPAPTERERGQWYFQRYVEQLPAAAEIALFDRSWYNRAGVERVMGYCTPQEYRRFLHQCPTFERLLVEDGVLLRKYWFSVSDEEQERRFRRRLSDPLTAWKFSENDLLTRDRWVDFSRAKDEMFVHTDIPEAPWWVVEADDKRARATEHDRPPDLVGALRARSGRRAAAAAPPTRGGLWEASSRAVQERSRPRRDALLSKPPGGPRGRAGSRAPG